MRPLGLMLVLFAAACGGTDKPVTPPVTPPDMMPAGPPVTPPTTPVSTQLLAGSNLVVYGVTDDDHVIYGDGTNILALPRAGGASIQVSPRDDLEVRGNLVTVHSEDAAYVWSAATGTHQFSLDTYYVYSDDGRYIVYTTVYQNQLNQYDLWLAPTDGSAAPVKIRENIGSCPPSAHFWGNSAAVSLCEPASQVGELILVDIVNGTSTPVSDSINPFIRGERDLVAFTDPTRSTLTLLRLPTGTTEPLPGKVGAWTIAGDGTLVYVDAGDHQLQRATTGTPPAVTDLQLVAPSSIDYFAASPDGKRALWMNYQGVFALADTTTPSTKPLFTIDAAAATAGYQLNGVTEYFSADSRFALFQANVNPAPFSHGTLTAVDTTNGSARSLADNVTEAYFIGERVAFAANRVDSAINTTPSYSHYEVYVVDLTGTAAPVKIAGNVTRFAVDRTHGRVVYTTDGANAGLYLADLQ